MGKRNVRILRQQLPDRLSELEGKEVHVVLTDGTTRFGKILGTTSDRITLQDLNAGWTSRKRHTHHIPLAQIMEAIYDLVADY